MSDRQSPRDRLLQAARDVVVADGLEGLTLRAIARRAGVSHGAPLRHFPSLAALLSAVAADGFARLIATVDRHLAEAEAAAASGGAATFPAAAAGNAPDTAGAATPPAAMAAHASGAAGAGTPPAAGNAPDTAGAATPPAAMAAHASGAAGAPVSPAAREAAARDAEAGGGVLGARQRLGVAARSYVDFALANPGVFSVMFRPERVDVTDGDYQLQGFASFAQLVGLVEAAQADGWHADLPSAELAAVLWAHVHGIAVLTVHGALPAVVGEDRVDSLPALSAALVLDLEMPSTVPTTHQGEPA